MKKAKKVLFVLLLSLIVNVIGITVFADDVPITLATSDFLAREGEMFSTTVYIPDNANIVDFETTLNYDRNLITLVNAEESEDIKGSVTFNVDTDGVIGINYTRTNKNVTSYMPLIDLTFKIDDNIGLGEYDCFTVDKNEAYIAHTLDSAGTLKAVDFNCNFAKLVIYEIGDVDLSTKVDIGDATYIRRHLAQIAGSVLTEFKLRLADTYTDDVVDIADAVCLQRHLAKYTTPFYGNRVNVFFYNGDGTVYTKKSVAYNGILRNIPNVPKNDAYSYGQWSQSASDYVEPVYSKLTTDIKLYPFYGGKIDPAMDYYKAYLTDKYYSGDLRTNLSSNLPLDSGINYQQGYHAALVWNSSSNYILNQTSGQFTKPTYPQDLQLGIRIISYDNNDRIVAEDNISFDYDVPGMYNCPSKAEVYGFLDNYMKDPTDGQYRINYDVKLISRVSNTVLPSSGALYDNCEVRLDWYQNVDGTLVPLNQVRRTTSPQINDYIVVATFNGKPLEDDGKIYFDDVEVTAIDELEIRNHIINQIAAKQGTLVTEGTSLWNNDTVYGTNVTWETGNAKIGYVANNVVHLKEDAVSGSVLPLNARVSYSVGNEVNEFILAYNLTVSCNNTKIVSGVNMDPELYKAIKEQLHDTLGYSGDLTSAALANVKFVNLDLSGHPDITSLKGLSYCTNLRTLNISGIHITDETMNQIATLIYLEAFIARGCGLDNLTDGGTATLKNAVNLKMIDLTDNNFTSLDSVFAEGVKYGQLREVYLASNRLTDINALSRAPMMTYLSLADNGLTSEGIASIANYPALTYLSLAHNNIDSIENLTGLKYLQELRLQDNNLENVRNLRKLINLQALYLGHNRIKDIGFFTTLTELKVLYVNDNQISDISTLNTLTKLEAINVTNNNIGSLSVLGNFKSALTEIYAENNRLTDFSFINGAANLHVLMLGGNQMDRPQKNMTTWLAGLGGLEVLTLSDIKLTDLAFLSSMSKLVRLDIANCGLGVFSGDVSNIELIADRYGTLRVLDVSNNDFNGSSEELLKLRDLTLLTVLYADNFSSNVDAYDLTYSMTELKYVSLENCGIITAEWLSKYEGLEYVDLAGNAIETVNLNSCLSNASQKTIQVLYLDTVADNCTFADAFRIQDFNVKRLSLENVQVGGIERLPYMDYIQYLNLTNTGLECLSGGDEEMIDTYSILRYTTLDTVDISHNDTDVTLLEEMPSLEKVYAVGAVDSERFYKNNLHGLQRLYNKDVTCYLYDKETEYVPTATREGVDILNLIEDFSCDITVADDYKISDNNPFIISEINDYVIDWSLSNEVNYEIVDNHLAVKSYDRIDDEELVVTASIDVYPDQAAVSRSFTINTHILRTTPSYYEIEADGYSETMTRDSEFRYGLNIVASETEGFSEPVKPVLKDIEFEFSAVSGTGAVVPYTNVITEDGLMYIDVVLPGIGLRKGYNIRINSDAPLGATMTMTIDVYHLNASGEKVYDIDQIVVPVTVASRTFKATFVMNGGTLTDANGVARDSANYVEDSPVFVGLQYSRAGYKFSGWYTDSGFANLFSADGSNALMPSHDITLYAKWTPLSFTVRFDANGGSVNPNSMTALSGVALGSLPTPGRSYYTFEGWYTAASGGYLITNSSVLSQTTDLTLYAHWRANTYRIIYNANGGSVSPANKTLTLGERVGALPAPYRDYYTFNGWFTAASGGTRVTEDTKYDQATDVTIYAQWTQNPEKGWVKASEAPAGAQITQTKWTYSVREYTTSGNSSIAGWTQYKAERTSWGGTEGPVYSRPTDSSWNIWSEDYVSGYGTRHMWHYYRYANSAGTAGSSVRGNTYWDEQWIHIPYALSNRSSTTSNGVAGWKVFYQNGNYNTVSGKYHTYWYSHESDETNYDDPRYSTRWYYQRPVYTYSFYRDVAKEATSDPTSWSNVVSGSVVKMVKYRAK